MSVSINGAGSISGLDQGFNVTTGSVGIGTDNPTTTFVVRGDDLTKAIRFQTNTSTQTSMLFQNSTTGYGSNDGLYFGIDQQEDGYFWHFENENLIFGTANTERIRITSDGEIGVGVASPQQKLDVVGSAHTVAVFRPDTNTVSAYGDASAVNNLINLRIPYGSNPGSSSNNGARWGIKFQGRNDGTEYGTDAGKSASIYAVSEETNSGYNRQVGLAFYTSGFDANQEERLRITSAGKIGVNITSPGCQTGGIHAVHNATEGTPSFTGGEVGIFQRNYNSSQGCEIGIIGGSNSSSRINFGDKDDADRGIISYSHSDDSMRFIVSAAERLRITSDGKVGIGEGQPDRVLHVKSGVNNNDGAIRIESANDNIMDVGTDGTGHFLNCVNADPFRIKFAGTEKLRITSDGRVCINATSPVFVGGQNPHLYVSSYTNLDGLRIRGLDTGNTIWKTGGDMSLTVASNDAINLKTNGTTRFVLNANSNNSTTLSIGNGNNLTNNTSPDRTSVKVGGTLHLEASNAGSNHKTGMYYNCYASGQSNFYQGTFGASSFDYRAAAATMNHGSFKVYTDPGTSTNYSAGAQITTMKETLRCANGFVTAPNQPCFFATSNTGGSHTSNGYTGIISNQLEAAYVNVGNHYNTSTGIFTCPVAGTYEFHGQGLIRYQGGTGRSELSFFKNGSNTITRSYGYTYVTGNNDHDNLHVMAYITCAVNDQIDLRVYAMDSGVDCYWAQGLGYFAGRLVQ